MSNKSPLAVWLVVVAAMAICPGARAALKTLPGHVPAVVAHLHPVGRVAATNQLRLAIGLSLRDPAGLDAFLAQLYDPASTNYHRYLTPTQLADRFGPTEQDYEAVKQFARTNGLTVMATFDNRLVLDVAGPAAAVEKALHITLHTYQHPTEPRRFFAPDTEPTVDADLPVADIQGLSDFSRPHPRLKKLDATKIQSHSGSAPDGSGSYFGDDFRNAYATGTALTGAGQMVGLLEFDGFYAHDIAAYAASAGGGRTNIVLQTVSINGYNGVPLSSDGNAEVSLDIEMAMAMAPGLAKIVVFEAGTNGIQNDILNSMLTFSNSVQQLSSSWGWGGGPSTTTDAIFKNMQGAGQSFFNASGDSDAFTTGASSANGVDNLSLADAPASSPEITQVGGTTLTMNGSSYASETVWNRGYDANVGGYMGSSGGISSYYSMPCWQTNVSDMAARGGSAGFRNIPDVALTADNVYTDYGNGQGGGGTGGTSCAAPLWAGFVALVNEQAAAGGKPGVGFINPAIYAIAAGTNYAACFHDVTTGDNTWPGSTNFFQAMTGYDLCTGLGTPNGAGLINALVDPLVVSPSTGYAFSGPSGGPFHPGSGVFQLTNFSSASLNWTLINTSAWLQAASANGTLAPHAATSVNVSLTAAASALALGNYSATVAFSNQTSQVAQWFPFVLEVYQPLSVSPVSGFTAVGPVGGPFTSASQSFVLTNLGDHALNWGIINTSAWLTAAATQGLLAAEGSVGVTTGLSPAASALPAAVYHASLVVTNPLGIVAALPFALFIGQPVIQNGGFETGDFTDWTLSGNTASTLVTDNPNYVYSGTYAAALGPASLGYLTQNLTTAAGENYIVSFWLRNPTGGTPNQFLVQWNGDIIFYQANITNTNWTNLQLLVTAPASVTPLQFGFQHNSDFFGLDDVNVTPLAVVLADSFGILPTNGFTFACTNGGPFNAISQTFLLTNSGNFSFNWQLSATPAWLTVQSAGGSLLPGGQLNVSVSLNAVSTNLAPGAYHADLMFSNLATSVAQLRPVDLLILYPSLVQNGGFETGDFTDWTLYGNTTADINGFSYIFNAVENAGFQVVHSGNYGAFLGDTSLAILSQALPTAPGQEYLLSFWLDNPSAGPGQLFEVNWNTNGAATTNTIYSMASPPAFTWTNLSFVLTATSTNTTLQFGAANPPNYFGLDDVSVTAVPAPSFSAVTTTGNGVAFTWNTFANVGYVIQYETNLSPATWVNLGRSIMATANTLTLTDINACQSSPQRFYRLVLAPP